MSSESLKVIENLTEFLYSEIKRASNDKNLDPKAFHILKDCIVDTINLKRKLELARSWVITKDQK